MDLMEIGLEGVEWIRLAWERLLLFFLSHFMLFFRFSFSLPLFVSL
jgi:hypothetical protein